MKVEHGVHCRVLHLLPNVCANNLDFGLGVSQMPGKEGVSETFEAFHNLKVIPGAHFFLLIGVMMLKIGFLSACAGIMVRTYQVLVFRPSTHRPNELLRLYALEASVFHPPLEIQARTRLDVSVPGCFDELIVEPLAGVFFLQRAVRGGPIEIEIDEFNPAARFGVSEVDWRGVKEH